MHPAPHRPPRPTHPIGPSIRVSVACTALVLAAVWTMSYPTTAAAIVGTVLALWISVRFGRPIVQSVRHGGSDPAVSATSEANR